jgi:hypothetical protein
MSPPASLWQRLLPASTGKRTAAIVLLLIGGVSLWMEWRARGDVEAFCSAQVPGTPVAYDQESLNAWRKAARQQHASLFVIDWRPDAPPTPAGNGALVATFLGAFPFGRETCMIRLETGRVARHRVVLGSDSYAYCGGDMRLITECPAPGK